MDAVSAVQALLTPAGRIDPYPLYDAVRAAGPAVPVGDDYVAVTGYAAADAVLRDPAYRVEDAEVHDLRYPGWREHRSLVSVASSMLSANAPEHERMRRLVSRAFTARRIAGLRTVIERQAAMLLDGMSGTVDFMPGFAYLLPVSVICELLGVPEEDREWFRPRAADLTQVLEFSLDLDELDRADRACDELEGYLGELVLRRRAAPGDDLTSALAASEGLTGTELLANLSLLLFAGFETTTNLLGNGLKILFDHPAALDRLRAAPELAPAYVEEMLRFDSPVQLTSRWTRAATTVGGVPLGAYGQILLLLGAANRDPDRFGHPDRFDPDRPGNTPLSFGGGAHFCLGAALARLEAQVAFPLLLARFPRLAPAGEPVHRDRLTLRGYAHLPVSVD